MKEKKLEQLGIAFKMILNEMIREIYEDLHIKSYFDTDTVTDKLLYEVKNRINNN